jgi:anthranilate synthase component I
MMTPERFNHLAAQGYNRIPVVREILADLDTPLSAYLKLAKGAYSYLLESVVGGEKWGRYSIIGLPARRVIKVWAHRIVVEEDGLISEEYPHVADPLAWIEAFQLRFKIPQLPELPRFTGGLVGYFGYDTVRYIEPRLAGVTHIDPLNTPDILLMVSEDVLVFDNLSRKLFFICHADPSQAQALSQAQAHLDALVRRLHDCPPKPEDTQLTVETVAESDFVSGFSQADYEAAIAKAQHYILEGDIMQVVLAQRLSIPLKQAAPLDVYRALRFMNPSPYMFYLDLDEFHIVGASPEILARLEQGQVTVRPIAGTRPRGKDEAEDLALQQDLLADPKELAEHLMLIDLGRNDVGRVAQTGTVRVTEKMIVERYSHVMHIVSNVTATLKPELSALDVLRATFPAGTLSGAPKIRAMEIIDELEPVKRGIYGGAVGYLAWNGGMDTAIAIRTAVIKDRVLYIQAGAGIVADSVPEREWQETMNKARAVFRAVARAVAGVQG